MAAFADDEQYDALGLADLVRRGKVMPIDLLEAAIDRVEARNPTVNAVIMPLYDHGRRAIADGLAGGPFRGGAFLVKALGAPLPGERMPRGSRFFADTPPSTFDSETVARLKRAGLVIFGRTNSCAAGLSLPCEPQLHGPPPPARAAAGRPPAPSLGPRPGLVGLERRRRRRGRRADASDGARQRRLRL